MSICRPTHFLLGTPQIVAPGVGDIPYPPRIPSPTELAAQETARSVAELRELLDARSPKGMVSQTVREIQEFERSVPPDHELTLRLLGAAGEVEMRLEHFNAYESGLIVFSGKSPDQTPARVLQHVTQTSFALGAVRRGNPETLRRRIGFSVIPEVPA
jgi:hypothetical protein